MALRFSRLSRLSRSTAPLAILLGAAAGATTGCSKPNASPHAIPDPAPPSVSATGADAAVSGATPGVTVLRGLRLIDGNGGPPIEEASLVLEGATIKAAGPTASTPAPAGAAVVEMAGLTVMPGMISDHSHIGIVDGLSEGKDNVSRGKILRELRQFEVYGVTTIASLAFNDELFYELQPVLHRGDVFGADIFGADRGIGVPGAAPPVDVAARMLYRPLDAEQARGAVRETASRHPTFVKIWVDDFAGTLPRKMAPEVYGAIIEEAHKQGLRVAAHVYYLEDARKLVADGVDVLAHGVRDKPVDAPFIAALAAHHTWYVPTLGLDETFYAFAEQAPWTKTPFNRNALSPAVAGQIDDEAWRKKTLDNAKKVTADKASVAMNLRNVKILDAAGASVGFGTDSGATALRIPGLAEHRELQLMVLAGLSPVQAIRHATHDAAAALGQDDRGSLEAGKLADFVVLDGNPATRIDDSTLIRAVWHRGKKVSDGPLKDAPVKEAP